MNRQSTLAYLILLCMGLSMAFFHGENEYTEITFSRLSGFYEEAFYLELYAPAGMQIYYTLDGSDPDESAVLYTAPILIEDPSRKDNVYAMRKDVSVGFLGGEKSGLEGGGPVYTTPDYPVDKCMVVRAACLDTDGNFGQVKTESYFVGRGRKKGYDGVMTASLVTDPENLFDYDKGIYVLGREYEKELPPSEEGADWFHNANYQGRGAEWERPAVIQFFGPDGQALLDQPCGIRVRGGVSRGMLPKSLNLYARGNYNGEGRFLRDLFGTGYMADTLTLYGGGQDYLSNFRECLMAGLASGRNFATMNFIPCVMFLDGEYWGLYYITEKYDAAYLAYYYNVSKDDVVMVKNGELSEGEEPDFELYTQMIAFFSDMDLTVPENYAYACELIDMESYIDYYAVQTYIGRHVDWPVENEALWRTRDVKDGSCADGRWRWMLFDVNSFAMSAEEIDYDAIGKARSKSAMFDNLCRNPDFKKRFTVTTMDLANTVFSPETVDPMAVSFVEKMEEPMRVNLKRFYGTESSEAFVDAVSAIQVFFHQRRPYAMQYLEENFSLQGKAVPVEISINDPTAGKIKINTVWPSLEEGFWRGDYYTDYPILLAAEANEGYHFVRWEYGGTSKEAVIELPLDEKGVSVRAVFEKL